MSLKQEAIWSTPTSMRVRCDWPWCWRRATQLCRVLVPGGDTTITFGRWYCGKHTAKRKALNLSAVEHWTKENP